MVSAQAPVDSVELPPVRVAGPDRVATSASLLRESLAAGVDWQRLVVVHPDTALALAASGLAGHLDAGVLVSRVPPSRDTLEAAAALSPQEVVVLSDQAALAEAWGDAGHDVTHLSVPGGPAALAAEAAREVMRRREQAAAGPVDHALLVGTNALADAVAAAAWAHQDGLPLLLTPAGQLDPHTAFLLDHRPIRRVTIVGGPAAVSADVAQALARRGVVMERVSGPTRHHTALAVAEQRAVGLDQVLLTAAHEPVDGASAGPHAAATNAAVLPVGEPVRQRLAQRCGQGLVITVVGGQAAVSGEEEGRHRSAAERCDGPRRPLTVRIALAGPDGDEVHTAARTAVEDPAGWRGRRLDPVLVGQGHTLGLVVAVDGCGGVAMCRRGRDVVIDAATWRAATPQERHRLVNLAIGHRLGLPLDDACTGGFAQPPGCPTPAPAVPDAATRAAVLDALVPTATLTFGGDVHAERHIAAMVAQGGNPLAPVAGLLADADLAVVNLETPLSVRGSRQPKTYTFRAPPAMADRLVQAGVDVANLANNHGLDYGIVAMLDTLEHATTAGLSVVGAGPDAAAAYTPSLHDTPAGTVAVVGLTRVLHTLTWEATAARPGLASAYDEAAAVAAVHAAQELADHVVVAIHWGTELADCPDGNQRRLARLLTDAGADVVVGHHPHVLQGVQVRNGSLVAYSMGNFVWYHNRAPSRYSGVLEVDLPLLDQPSWRLHPAEIGTDGAPHPADGATAAAIHQRVRDRSPGGVVGCAFPG